MTTNSRPLSLRAWHVPAVLAASCAIASPALGQLSIPWWTVDGGGGISSGGSLTVIGTVGQADAGTLANGSFAAVCGFWSAGAPACYANCDGSSGSPQLTGNDFLCFINSYALGQPYANCDGSTGSPLLTANDFTCFINAYALGCP